MRRQTNYRLIFILLFATFLALYAVFVLAWTDARSDDNGCIDAGHLTLCKSFLPLVSKGHGLPTPAPTMNPTPDVTYPPPRPTPTPRLPHHDYGEPGDTPISCTSTDPEIEEVCRDEDI